MTEFYCMLRWVFHYSDFFLNLGIGIDFIYIIFYYKCSFGKHEFQSMFKLINAASFILLDFWVFFYVK